MVRDESSGITWFDASELYVGGRAHCYSDHQYARCSREHKSLIGNDVYAYLQQSAGVYIDFLTDASDIHVRWTVRYNILVTNMNPIAVRGLDLYAESDGNWRWAAVAKPGKGINYEANLLRNLPKKARRFRIYLPLFAPVRELSIGLSTHSILESQDKTAEGSKRICVYGGSTAQGACASRPGMAWTAILGRESGYEVFNLSTSGHCSLSKSILPLIAATRAEIFVLECYPNVSTKDVAEKLHHFLELILESAMCSYIILLNRRSYGSNWLAPTKVKSCSSDELSLLRAVGKVAKIWQRQITVIPGIDLGSEYGQLSVDGIHPNDAGHYLVAKAISTKIRIRNGTSKK